MFNNKQDDEADFCESYKSQVLGTDSAEKGTSFFSTILKLLTILILLGIIAGVSFYGYNYFMDKQKESVPITMPPVSIQVSEEDLVVTDDTDVDEELESNLTKETLEENSTEEMNGSAETNSSEEEISLEIPLPTPEAQYLEQLADLSKEIDKERKE